MRAWLWAIPMLGLCGVWLVLQIPPDMMTPVDGQKARWGVGILFGVLIVAAFLFAPGRLELDREGFSERSNSEIRHNRWRDVSGFEVNAVGYGKTAVPVVAYSSADRGETYLRSSYGLELETLAKLMNSFRDRALANSDK
jgi:hypothetical protein